MLPKFGSKYLDALFFLFFPLLACIYLWSISSLSPYGTPLNELSDQYWGILIDVARQWKTGEFSFWTRSIGGGFCLYSSGFYPLWVPSNFMAKFLSYDHFYLFKIIEPYFIGLFAMTFLLRRGLRLNYLLVMFGALTYCGFVFTRYVGIIHFPFFLWACAFFPLMLYFYITLFSKHIYLRSAVLGVSLAVIFIGGGGGQFAQLTIWGLILLVLDALCFSRGKAVPRKMFLAVASCAIFVFFSFAVAGVQILPMAVYTLTESSRTLGEYPINNFPFFRNDYKGSTSIFRIFTTSLFFEGDQGVRAFWALVIFACGKLIVNWKMFRCWLKENPALGNVGLTTGLFFLVPPTAEGLSHVFPFCAKIFNPLRMFTFGYCGFMIDMLLVLFVVVVFSLETFKEKEIRPKKEKTFILLVGFLFAQIYLFYPLWWSQIFSHQPAAVQIDFRQRYVALVALLLLGFPFRRAKFIQAMVLTACFIFIGGHLFHTSYVWGEKGQRTKRAHFYFKTPEHSFYQNMKHRYYMAYVDPQGQSFQYETMTHDYDLLFGVDGVNGFLNSPPKRFSDFLNAYHNQTYWTKNTTHYKFNFKITPASLTTYFPVEFTTVKKGMLLPWPGFSKAVDGDRYDVWIRDTPVERVKFAGEVKVVPFRELIDVFDRPYDGAIYMTPEDYVRFSPQSLKRTTDVGETFYRNFKMKKSGHWAFDVFASDDVFVFLPEMFQAGWQLRVDNIRQPLFPAHYLFMGFKLDKGEHGIDLEFRPVLWNAGLFLSVVGTGFFLWIIYFYREKIRRVRHEKE